MKVKITSIVNWAEDTALIAGDASHNGNDAVRSLLEDERTKKMRDGSAVGLPFICEALSIDDAVEQYNNAFCEFDYLKASECEWENA